MAFKQKKYLSNEPLADAIKKYDIDPEKPNPATV